MNALARIRWFRVLIAALLVEAALAKSDMQKSRAADISQPTPTARHKVQSDAQIGGADMQSSLST
jgi:hypothetical protein